MGDIYVIRHGAYQRGESGEKLTPVGRDQAESAAYGLQAISAGDWQLLSSKAPRAVQTAERIGSVLEATPIFSDLISFAGDHPEDADAFEKRLKAALLEGGVTYDEELPLAVVGHLPLLICVDGDAQADVGNGEIRVYDSERWNGSAAQ